MTFNIPIFMPQIMVSLKSLLLLLLYFPLCLCSFGFISICQFCNFVNYGVSDIETRKYKWLNHKQAPHSCACSIFFYRQLINSQMLKFISHGEETRVSGDQFTYTFLTLWWIYLALRFQNTCLIFEELQMLMILVAAVQKINAEIIFKSESDP